MLNLNRIEILRLIMNVLTNIGTNGQDRPDILTPVEVEAYVEAIDKSKLMDLGSLSWLEKHERIKQLAIQAVIQAMSQRDEMVKNELITMDKLPTLVHDLILIEIWKEKVFPELLKEIKEQRGGAEGPHNVQHCGFIIYPILYHEGVIINLLSTVLYHSSAVEGLQDSALDLLDYCLRNLTQFVSSSMTDKDEEDEDQSQNPSGHPGGDAATPAEVDIDLKRHSDNLGTSISIKCLSILRHLIENADEVGAGFTSRLIVSSDTPMLLTELIVQKPWRKEYWRSGKVEEFDTSKNEWKKVNPLSSSRTIIGNIEAQAWLSLYLLLKNNDVLGSYELYESRKNNLIKLLPYLNERTVDQIPVLGELNIFLNQLLLQGGGTSPFGPSKSPLLLEMVPPIRSQLEKEFNQKSMKLTIISHFKKELIFGSRELMMEKAKRLASAYNIESFEPLLSISRGKCEKCGRSAEKKCSRCRKVWYCGRECQVKDWREKHKDNCP